MTTTPPTKLWTFHVVDHEILANNGIDDSESIPTTLWTTRDKAQAAAEEAIREDLRHLNDDGAEHIEIHWMKRDGELYFCTDDSYYSCRVVALTVKN